MNATLALGISAILLLFAGLGSIGFALGATTTPASSRTGIRGLKRQRALTGGGAWAQVEPLVRWLGNQIRGVIGTQLLASLDRQISMAGGFLGLLPEELVALSGLSAAGGLAAGLLADMVVRMGPMLAVSTAAFGAVAPFLTLSSATADRLKAIGRRLPDAVDLLAMGMGAGLDFPGALRQAVEKSGTPDDPLIEELSFILLSLKLGRSRRQALEEFRERAPIDAVQEFVGSVVQAELRGNPVADVLRIQSGVSRQRRTVRAEELAAKAGVSMILPLVLVFVAILVLIAGPMIIRLRSTQGM